MHASCGAAFVGRPGDLTTLLSRLVLQEATAQVHHMGLVINPADFSAESHVRRAHPEIEEGKMHLALVLL